MTTIQANPIHRKKLSHEIRDHLREHIEKGAFKVGDKLPSEHQLMELFQVGRPAVREALQALENDGLITIRHGGGATVNQPSAALIFNQIDHATRHLLSLSNKNVEHLQEARQIFEAGAVRLAVARATKEDIEQLREKLDEMITYKGDRIRFVEADLAFHTKIAQISRNPIIINTSKALLNWLKEYQRSSVAFEGLEPLTIKEHEAILERILARDHEGAAKVISDHILRVNQLYIKHRGNPIAD
jgi:DNA-binding FadR family transcriptional regulator